MANLTVNIDGKISYSDGVYLPSDGATEFENGIINLPVQFDSGEIILRAVVNTPDGIMLDFPENDDELQRYNSSYIVACDAEWITLKRERNVTRLIFKPNYDIEARTANITVKHNTEKDVYCVIYVTQYGDDYELEVDSNEIDFGLEPETKNVTVTCQGGTGEYTIHKVKKYTNYVYSDVEITKRVNYDNALSVTKDNENNIAIHSFGSLMVDDSYYEITLEHKDMIGLTQKIKVIVAGKEQTSVGIPEISTGDSVCAEENRLPVKITAPHDDNSIPNISLVDERDSEIWIDSSDYCDEIFITTVPEESQIYFTYYGSFIDKYKIVDYEERDGSISHGLRVKAKPNPFGIGRSCIGYITNAMYPQSRIMLRIRQDGNT